MLASVVKVSTFTFNSSSEVEDTVCISRLGTLSCNCKHSARQVLEVRMLASVLKLSTFTFTSFLGVGPCST